MGAIAAAGAATIAVCLLVVVIASRPLSGSTAAPKPARAAPERHPSAQLPAAARGMVARALGGSGRRFFVRRAAGGFAVLDARAGVDARFTRDGTAVRAGGAWWALSCA
jgi:hypothetical protein